MSQSTARLQHWRSCSRILCKQPAVQELHGDGDGGRGAKATGRERTHLWETIRERRERDKQRKEGASGEERKARTEGSKVAGG